MPPRPRTAPRKSAVQERSRATVDAILQATARVLVKVGYDRASTNRVAAAAGVSIGSLYQYFPSKEALVAALIEKHVADMTTLISAALAESLQLPVDRAVRRLVEVMIEAHALDPALHKVLVEQTPRVGRLQQILDLETQLTALARAYLAERADQIRDVDLDVAAFVLVHSIEALTHAAVLTRPDLLGKPELVDEIAQLVVRYLRR
jgi:AcrR family transcriptional regulator